MKTIYFFLFLTFCQIANAQYPLDLASANFTLPKTSDERLAKVLTSPSTVFYKIPRYYQLKSSRYQGVFEAHYLRDHNANLDFPWDNTFGINGFEHTYTSVNFLFLPGEPVAVIKSHPVKWIFPTGAIVGELLLVDRPGGKGRIAYEIRTREKTATSWKINVYRPVANREEFMELMGVQYTPKYKFLKIENPENDKVFVASGNVEILPKLNEVQVDFLLSLPFKDVTEDQWTPCSNDLYSLFPKDYKLGLIDMDDSRCQSCHAQTQVSVDRLIPGEKIIYEHPNLTGRIRGSDGIFSWNPYGKVYKDGTYEFRKQEFENGRIAFYDPEIHKNYKIAYFVDRGEYDHRNKIWDIYGLTGIEKYSKFINRVGFLVTDVKVGGNAAKSGIKRNDVIYMATPVDKRSPAPAKTGYAVKNFDDLEFMSKSHSPVRFYFVRNNTQSNTIMYPVNYTFDNSELITNY